MGVVGSCSSACSSSFEASVIPDIVKPPSEPSCGSRWALCLKGNVCRSWSCWVSALWLCLKQHNPWVSTVKGHVEVSRWGKHSDKTPLSCSFTCVPVPHVGPLVISRLSLQSCRKQPSSITAPWVLTACEFQLRLRGRYPGKSFLSETCVIKPGSVFYLKFLRNVSKTWKSIVNLWPLGWKKSPKKPRGFGPKCWGTHSSVNQAYEHNLKCLFKRLYSVKHFLLIIGFWPQLYSCRGNHKLHNLVCLHFKDPLTFGDACLSWSHMRGGHKWISFGNPPKCPVWKEHGGIVAHQGLDCCICTWEWEDAGGGPALVNGFPDSVTAEQLMLAVICWFSDSAANVQPCFHASWACWLWAVRLHNPLRWSSSLQLKKGITILLELVSCFA